MNNTTKIQQSNQIKFSALREFNLPTDQYAIIGSGPLGIRNLKAIGDIDIIVTPQLWDALAKKYGITDINGVKKIIFPGEIIEAFSEGSFYSAPIDVYAASMASRINNAELIDGLPFDSIENVLYYKHKSAREKDLQDIRLIEEWQKNHQEVSIMRAKLYREHKYVSFALSELERLIAKTDFTDDVAITIVQKEWQRLKEMLEGHAYHEENNFHTLLEKKGSTIHREAHDDHERQEESLENLQRLLDATLVRADRVEAGYRFYLAYRKFVGDNLLHLHEEETKLLPELQRLCTDEELRAIEYPTYEVMTPDEMIEMVQVLFPHMNFSDKCAFLADIKCAQPDKFLGLWERASCFLSAEEIQKFQGSECFSQRC